MDDALVLAIDQGTHGSRALVLDHGGGILASASRRVSLHRIDAGRVEQDAMEILGSVREVVRAVLADPALEDRVVASAGLATQRSSVVAWNRRTGRPLGPVLSWQDRRAADWMERFAADAPRVHRLTGLPLSPHYGVGKLHWLLANNLDVAAARRRGELAFGPLAAWLAHRLVEGGPMRVDHANASRTLLWGLASRDWEPELLDLFGIPGELLPACRPIRADHGRLRGTGIPLTAISGDQNAALYSAGPPAPDVLRVNIGTGAFVLLPTGERIVSHDRLLAGIADSDADGAHHVLEGTVNGAGAAIDWAMKRWRVDDALQRLPQWLETTSEIPVFLNTVGGLGSPWWRAGPETGLAGDPAVNRSQALVAVVESILFLIQANIDAFREAGATAGAIRISGGLARLDGLCRRLANLSGLPVTRPAGIEATARGIGWLAAGRPAGWSRPGTGERFDPVADRALSGRYARFRREMGLD